MAKSKKKHPQIQAQRPLSVGSDVCDTGVIGTLFLFHSHPKKVDV